MFSHVQVEQAVHKNFNQSTDILLFVINLTANHDNDESVTGFYWSLTGLCGSS